MRDKISVDKNRANSGNVSRRRYRRNSEDSRPGGTQAARMACIIGATHAANFCHFPEPSPRVAMVQLKRL